MTYKKMTRDEIIRKLEKTEQEVEQWKELHQSAQSACLEYAVENDMLLNYKKLAESLFNNAKKNLIVIKSLKRQVMKNKTSMLSALTSLVLH